MGSSLHQQGDKSTHSRKEVKGNEHDCLTRCPCPKRSTMRVYRVHLTLLNSIRTCLIDSPPSAIDIELRADQHPEEPNGQNPGELSDVDENVQEIQPEVRGWAYEENPRFGPRLNTISTTGYTSFFTSHSLRPHPHASRHFLYSRCSNLAFPSSKVHQSAALEDCHEGLDGRDREVQGMGHSG